MTTPTDYDPARLFDPTYVPASTGILYTAPAIDAVQLTSLKVVNVSAAAATISLYIVPSGGAVLAQYKLVSSFAVPYGDGLPYELIAVAGGPFYMNPGDTLQGACDPASSVVIHGSGVLLD